MHTALNRFAAVRQALENSTTGNAALSLVALLLAWVVAAGLLHPLQGLPLPAWLDLSLRVPMVAAALVSAGGFLREAALCRREPGAAPVYLPRDDHQL
jgi:uncharacterized membrane protein YhdT